MENTGSFGQQAQKKLLQICLSKWDCIFHQKGVRVSGVVLKIYSFIKLELLYNSHLGISKILKECIVFCFSSETALTGDSEKGSMGGTLAPVRSAVLCGCNSCTLM